MGQGLVGSLDEEVLDFFCCELIVSAIKSCR